MPIYFLITIYMILAGVFTPLLRYVSGIFSPFTQNGTRFLAGGIMLLCIAIVRYFKNKESGIEFLDFLKKKYYIFIAIITCMCTNMVYMSKGLILTSSFTGTMFSTFGIPVTTIVAAIFFQDERKKATHFTFILGMIICLCGSYIFITKGANHVYNPQGVVYLTISVIAQVLLNNLVKYITRHHSVVYTSTINSLGTGCVLLFLATTSGQISELTVAPPIHIVILIGVGLLGITMGMLLGFTLIKKTGISNFNILQLLTPVVVALFAYIFFNERTISFSQIYGAGIILLGATLCIFGQKIVLYIRSKSW